MAVICTCQQCGRDFAPKRAHARYCSDACRALAWRENGGEEGGERVQGHALDEVRARHEESKGHWTTIVREHLNRTLLQTGFVSAEDFDALGIPDEHHNLANAQMGACVKNGYMEPVTWRRSSKASRKSGKIWTYRITAKGRAKLAGVDTDAPSPPGGGPNRALAGAGVHPGESRAGDGEIMASPSAPPAATAGAVSPEPLTLVPDEVGRRRPRSAISDPEAA